LIPANPRDGRSIDPNSGTTTARQQGIINRYNYVTSTVVAVRWVDQQVATASSKMQQRKNEIAAKRARLEELRRIREERNAEFASSRQSIGVPSEVCVLPKLRTMDMS